MHGIPVIVHTYSTASKGTEHWVAAVGYKGNGQRMKDLLFISCTTGKLCVNGEEDVHDHNRTQAFKVLKTTEAAFIKNVK